MAIFFLQHICNDKTNRELKSPGEMSTKGVFYCKGAKLDKKIVLTPTLGPLSDESAHSVLQNTSWNCSDSEIDEDKNDHLIDIGIKV